jgi:hypothetical protein
MVPAPVTVALRAIDQSQGSERAFTLQHPEALKTLVQIARVQSVECANAIEGVTAPHAVTFAAKLTNSAGNTVRAQATATIVS